MRTVGRRSFSTGVLALLAGACGRVAEDEGATPGGALPVDAGAGIVPGKTPPTEPFVAFEPVDIRGAPPSVVWSWTTAAQAAELRAGSALFTVAYSPTMGRGFLFDLLQERANAGDKIATRLVGRELAKGRFGWHNPWATVLGATEGESYGLELLAIRMKPDTLYARVSALDPTISFVDGAGTVVTTEVALAAYDRVGGILFDNDLASGRGCGTLGAVGTATGGGDLVYREIYLGNEGQVASFSHRTPEILEAIEASRTALVSLRDLLGSPPRTRLDWACRTSSVWRYMNATGQVETYLASLAFATERYDPTVANVDALVTELERARFTPDPFVVTR